MRDKITVICTGNICRSPMGEAMLKKAIENLPKTSLLKSMRVDSAGVWGEDGMGATYEAKAACKEIGLDLSKHIAKTLSPALLNETFALVAMTRAHLAAVKRMFSESELPPIMIALNSVVPSAKSPDIADPWGYGQQTYNNVRDEIALGISHLINFLEKKLSK